MNFKNFLLKEESELSDLEIANSYFQGNENIRSLSEKTGKSIGEIYRIIHVYGKPNRRKKSYDLVHHLHSSGMDKKHISDFTGYSKRHISNIIKNNN